VAGSALALVALVAGFLALGRLRMKNFVKDLPQRLGVGITQDSNSFTYDQSSKGKKIFTVHAAKEVQRKNGTIALHDVEITLYNQAGKPADHIHGVDFEYNQKAALLTAQGEVFIDLVPPEAKDAGAKPLTPEEREAKLVHVKTMGLVFDQKAQSASSDGAVEFRSEGYSGSSVGAAYDAKNGVVVLRSAVRIIGLRDERPVVLTAARAEMDRKQNVVDLTAPRYVSTGDGGVETAAATHVWMNIAKDGTPQRVNAEGKVTLASDRRGTVVSDRLDMELGPKGQARAAHLYGKVHYTDEQDGKRREGRAEDARIAFDDAGRPVHAVFGGGTTFAEQGSSSARNLQAATVEVVLAGGGKQPTIVKNAVAYGPDGARMRLVDEDGKGRRATDVAADRLAGQFAAAGRVTELTGLDGMGHTWVHRVVAGPRGKELSDDTSRGDTLWVDFKTGEKGRSELARAEQRGNVTTVYEAARKPNEKPGPPEIEHARAEDAVYEADLVHLTGSVELQDATSALFADRMDVNRGTGDAFAAGSVRVTYVQPPVPGAVAPATSAEPVHVLAARAVAHKATNFAEFFGDAGTKARMWQGASQVQAPVLDFYRKDKRVVAKGNLGSEAAEVLAVLVGAAKSGEEPGQTQKRRRGPARVVSREMVYEDGARTVTFTGSVRLVDQDGTMTSMEATVWLAPATGGEESSGFMGGRVDHMLATGSVSVEQPGRTATGERLIYTASDGIFVMTGSKAAPPKVMDRLQGTTTGAVLKFRSGDDSVEVLGSEDGRSGRVRTETRVKQ
jgi:lipopolysaccharide export system protein LptA